MHWNIHLKLLLTLISVLNQLSIAQYSVIDTSGCVFPFKMDGQTISSCITADQDYSWCSYTSDFIGVWKYCNDMRVSTWKCVDDCVLYQNENYLSCQTDQPHGRRKYCTEKILDMNKKSSDIISNDCPSQYKAIPFHTGCLNPSIYLAKSGIIGSDKKVILDIHNDWRKKVTEPAAAMLKLYWDDDLAYLAQKHADQCIFTHDDANRRSIPKKGKKTGQNIVLITGKTNFDWTFALNTMFKIESVRWDYGTGLKKEYADYGKDALHYTQILLDHLTKVGCGYSECVYADRLERHFVCNYNAIQMDYELNKPYLNGPSCHKCPNHCSDNLCDCNGIECYNGGVVDVSTCTCKCQGMWSGNICDIPIQPTHDSHGCSVPFLYNNTLNFDCVLDISKYPAPFCFTVPVFDNDGDHFLECDWKEQRSLIDSSLEALDSREAKYSEEDLNKLFEKLKKMGKKISTHRTTTKPITMGKRFQNAFDFRSLSASNLEDFGSREAKYSGEDLNRLFEKLKKTGKKISSYKTTTKPVTMGKRFQNAFDFRSLNSDINF